MFRFTIRELVLLTLVVAMGVGWSVDRARLVVTRESYRKRAEWSELESKFLRIKLGYPDPGEGFPPASSSP